jgi:hypothetical protein
LKSFFSSEWLITCFVPTLFAGRRNAAYPTPLEGHRQGDAGDDQSGRRPQPTQDFHLFDLLLGLP